MKRTVSVLTGAALLLSCNTFSVFAEGAPEPASLPDIVYNQLINNEIYDTNTDGMISEEEYENAEYISLDLRGVDSIDFLSRLKKPRYIYLVGGDIDDFSLLSEFKGLETLQLSDMPQLTDISFAKGMNLKKFYIVELEQITDEQKIDIMTFHDADTSVGYNALIGATPEGMFEYKELSLEIADTSVANFNFGDNPTQVSCASVFGKKPGTSEYTFSINGKEIHKGSITVTESPVTALDSVPDLKPPEVYDSTFYSEGRNIVLLKDNTIYRLRNGIAEVVSEDIEGFSRDYTYDETGLFTGIEILLHTDGTVEINGEAPENADGLTFRTVGRHCCITEKGDVYSVRKENGKYFLDLIYSGFGYFPEKSSMYFVSDKGEVVIMELKKTNSKFTGYQAFPTGIMNPTSSYNNFFIDDSKQLWEVRRSVGNKPTAVRRASGVEFVGYRYYNGGNVYGCVHITSDGTAYSAGTSQKVILSDKDDDPVDYKIGGNIYFNDTNGIAGYNTSPFLSYDYHISNDDVLYIEFDGKKAAFADVDRYICASRESDSAPAYIYFMKKDGSAWSYRFDSGRASLLFGGNTGTSVMGDVNGNGELDFTDAIILQDWLLGVPGTELPDWKAADLNDNDRLDVFDLCLLKKLLITE